MDYVYVGKIVNTHGIKGELRIKSNFEYKDKVFKSGTILYIGDNKCSEEIISYRKHKEFDMVCFKNYSNINEVLKYLKCNVYVDRSILDVNYVLDDLINLNIVFNNNVIGRVDNIFDNNGNTLLYIKGDKEFYIPYNDNFIKNVDLNSGTIVVENVEGLL